MPLYDYRCESCSHEFETLQTVNDAPLRDCPACREPALKKKVSAPAFTFKGSGWYKDLYGSPAPSKSGSETKAESSGEKASESKPKAADTKKKSTAASK